MVIGVPQLHKLVRKTNIGWRETSTVSVMSKMFVRLLGYVQGCGFKWRHGVVSLWEESDYSGTCGVGALVGVFVFRRSKSSLRFTGHPRWPQVRREIRLWMYRVGVHPQKTWFSEVFLFFTFLFLLTYFDFFKRYKIYYLKNLLTLHVYRSTFFLRQYYQICFRFDYILFYCIRKK